MFIYVFFLFYVIIVVWENHYCIIYNIYSVISVLDKFNNPYCMLILLILPCSVFFLYKWKNSRFAYFFKFLLNEYLHDFNIPQ